MIKNFAPQKKRKCVYVTVFTIFVSLTFAFPFIYAFLVSMMSSNDIFSKELILFPSSISTENYQTVFRRVDIGTYLKNSFIVATTSSFFRIFFGSMAAFALAFFQFKGKRFAFLFIIASVLIPQEVIFVQNYVTISNMGLLNTHVGICSVYLINAMMIFVLRQNFLSFPDHLRDAALLDGCGNLKFFFRILLPSSIPLLITTYLTSFVTLWNIYLWPMVITNDDKLRTMQVAITLMKGRDSPDFGPVMAAATISLLPALFLFLFSHSLARKHSESYTLYE